MTRTQGTPEKAFTLGWRALRRPTRLAEDARKPENIVPAIWVFVAFSLCYLVYFWQLPFDFPDANAPIPWDMRGLGFWTDATLWQIPTELAFIAFLVGMVEWFRSGKLAVRLIAGVGWTALPFILVVGYLQAGMPKSVLAAGTAIWLGLFWPLWKRSAAESWRAIATLTLTLNAIGIAIFVPMALCVWLDLREPYKYVQAAGGLWMLAAATAAIRRLCELRMSRAFMAVLLAMILQIAIVVSVYSLGLVPATILKALMYG